MSYSPSRSGAEAAHFRAALAAPIAGLLWATLALLGRLV